MLASTHWSRALTAGVFAIGLLSSPVQADEVTREGDAVIPVMFVQNASASHYSDGMLTLTGIKPEIMWFSNRPYRMAGTSPLSEYMQDWGDGADSFKANPPNGSLSYLQGDSMASVALELSEPLLVGDKISYQVKLLEGTLPAKTGPVSLFVDFVGMVWHRPVVGRPLVVRRPVVVARPFVFKPAPVVVTTPTTVVVKKEPTTTVVVNKVPQNQTTVVASSETEKKLTQLKSMYEQGLISRREYKQKQEELLKQF